MSIMNWKLISLYFLFLVVVSCSKPLLNSSELFNKFPVGIPKKTKNPNTPYIYANGFKDYTFHQEKYDLGDTIYDVTKLKFNAVLSSFYTMNIMFSNFGYFNKKIRFDKPHRDFKSLNRYDLVWYNIKLLEHDSRTYTVIAQGDENWEEIYCSIIIIDNEKKDALSSTHPMKKDLLLFFIKEIQNPEKNHKTPPNIYPKRN